MNHLSKFLTLAAFSSLSLACASRTAAPSNTARLVPRACISQHVDNDAKLQALAGCTRIEGDLTISGTVTTLKPLASVETVQGALALESTAALDSLDGLEGVRQVSSLLLTNNAALDDITALRSLGQVRSITLKHNPELKTLSGLEGVRALEQLAIVDNGLYNLRGLGNLTTLGELVVVKNRRLVELRALSGVVAAERVVVVNNPLLSGYGGVLANLQQPPTFATISGNPFTIAETSSLTRSAPTRSRAGFASIRNGGVASVREL